MYIVHLINKQNVSLSSSACGNALCF